MRRRFFIVTMLTTAWLGFTQPSCAQGTIAFHQPSSPIILRSQGFDEFYPFDFNGDGNAEMTFVFNFQSVGVRNEVGTRSLSFVNPPPDSYADPQPLPERFLIGPDSGVGQLQWFAGYPEPYNFNTLVYIVNTGTSGAFAGHHAYMGVEFQREGNTHYGWMLLQVSGNFAAVAAIEAWAWEMRPGVPIFAGAVPEPSTLALLVGGGLLIVCFKRKRNERSG